MSIRNKIRETEKIIKSLSSVKSEQVAIISKAQSLADEYNITILALVKNRIIRAMNQEQ